MWRTWSGSYDVVVMTVTKMMVMTIMMMIEVIILKDITAQLPHSSTVKAVNIELTHSQSSALHYILHIHP